MASKRGPSGWKKRVQRVLLNVISLGRVCASALEAEDTETAKGRRRNAVAALHRDNELLRQELRLKDARMEGVPARRRPHYSPVERMEILELKAARGWSTAEAARRFHVSEATVTSWLRRSGDSGNDGLLQVREPVNKFPDLIRAAVRRLKMHLPVVRSRRVAA